jgi:hypothetical protein
LSQLSETEKERLAKGITVAYSIPFIDDIEDFIWEAIFAHVRQIPLVDPLTETREKKLFDLVDKKRKIGWSAKALQTNVKPGGEFEFVIQRANIFKKAKSLGFPPLSVKSSPALLGKALMKHWFDEKIKRDMSTQGVDDPRVCILLKSTDRTRFTFVEEPLEIFSAEGLDWRWTDSNKTGLQGWKGGQLMFRWYHGQTQFFQRFRVPDNAPVITLSPKRLAIGTVISALHTELQK